jgi:hypothetical protein
VAIWTRAALPTQPYQLDGELAGIRESVWCEIPMKQRERLLLGAIYRSPNSVADNDAKLNEPFFVAHGRSHVLICGDFNHPEVDWLDVCTPKDCNHPTSKFVEAVRDSFLVQFVQKPTHYRGNQTQIVMDLIFALRTIHWYMKSDMRRHWERVIIILFFSS